MKCRHCGKQTAQQSVEGQLALMADLYKFDFRIEEAHNGGFLVFADYDSQSVAEPATRSDALQFIWDQLCNPEEYA